jgi:hypothetical protein
MSADKGKPREREKGSSYSTERGGSRSSKKRERKREKRKKEKKLSPINMRKCLLPTECVLMNN